MTQFPGTSFCPLPGYSSWPGFFFCGILMPLLWACACGQFQNLKENREGREVREAEMRGLTLAAEGSPRPGCRCFVKTFLVQLQV